MLMNVGMLKDISVAYFIKNSSISDDMTSLFVYFSCGQTDIVKPVGQFYSFSLYQQVH